MNAAPQSHESEEAIIGAMMVSQMAREAAIEAGLRCEHFFLPAHRTIFDAIVAVQDQDHVDEVVVIAQLKATKGTFAGNAGTALDAVGGPVGVLEISERVPAAANARAYAEDVIRQATFRMIVEAGRAIIDIGHTPDLSPKEAVDKAGQVVSALTVGKASGDFVTLDSMLGDWYDALADRFDAGTDIVGLQTGFPPIDRILGGLQKQKLIVLAARPAMGKTALMLNIIKHLALVETADVAVFSMEMGIDELAARLISDLSSIDGNRLRNIAPIEADLQGATDAIATIMRLGRDRIHVDPSVDVTPHAIRAKARRLARRLERKGRGLNAVFVDYMQLMESSGRRENRVQEVSEISRQLKLLAMELDVPVIALSQLSRKVEERPDKRPQLSDLRESGSIEQDADQVAFLFRPEVYWPDDPTHRRKAEVIVAKNRGGRIGSELLGFQGKYTRFVPYVPHEYVAGTGGPS